MLFNFSFVLAIVFISLKRTGFQQEWTYEYTEKEKGVESLGREDSASLVFITLMMSDILTGELVQSSAVSVSGSSPSALRHWPSVYVKFALGNPGAALWFTWVHGRWRGQTSLSLFILLCFCLSVSCSGRIGCTCLKSLRRLLLFTECVFLSDTLPVSQSAGRVKGVCDSIYIFNVQSLCFIVATVFLQSETIINM